MGRAAAAGPGTAAETVGEDLDKLIASSTCVIGAKRKASKRRLNRWGIRDRHSDCMTRRRVEKRNPALRKTPTSSEASSYGCR